MDDRSPPRNAADMVEVAEALLKRFYDSQEFIDLYGAVLSTVHIADWHFEVAPDQHLTSDQKEALEGKYAEFGTLTDLANGLKHGLFPLHRKREPSSARLLVLKRIDAWEDGDETAPGPVDGWDHLGIPDYWVVEHNGQQRSVFTLCEGFIEAFRREYLGTPAKAPMMTKDQIPAFIQEILATGCPVDAVGHDMYVIAEIDVPEEEIERVSREVQAICERYGERDHLLLEIVAHLRSLGRFIELEDRPLN